MNFLAAGASYPAIGSTGSGIYNGRNGILVATMQYGMGERTLYTAQVPKYHSPGIRTKRSVNLTPRLTSSDIQLKTDHLQSYDSVLIDLYNKTSLSQDVCFIDTSFCCHFELKWQKVLTHYATRHYQYRLGAFDAQRYEEGINSNQLKNCAVFSCTGSDIMDCGKMMAVDTDVVFENITISGRFPKTETFLLMPNSLLAEGLMPVAVTDFEWIESFEAE